MMYPRVLIVGHCFSGVSGASVTLSNLFKEWPAESLAVLAYSPSVCCSGTMSKSDYAYRLGDKETCYHPLLRLFYPKQKSLVCSSAAIRNRQRDGVLHSERLFKMSKLIKNKLLDISGLSTYSVRYQVSDDLLAWINDFNPQIIYTALGSLCLVEFTHCLSDRLSVPLAIHVWDDWLRSIPSRSVFASYLKKKYDRAFSNLLNKKNILLFSICDAMSIEYEARYGKKFQAFHNPVDLQEWASASSSLHEPSTVLYMGKISKEIAKCLVSVAECIQGIKRKYNLDMKLVIYSKDADMYMKTLRKLGNVDVNSAIPRAKLLRQIKDASILFLPVSFRKQISNYYKLSFPTKMPEYMVSGVPILIWAPEDIALSRYALETQSACVVTSQNPQDLGKAIFSLATNAKMRVELSRKANQIAISSFNADNIRSEFRQILGGALKSS